MEPISAVSLGASQPTVALQSGAGAQGTSGLQSPELPVQSVGASDSQSGTSDIAQLVGLLQSLDGGDNSKLVKMLVGLMILLALLQQLDGNSAQSASHNGTSGADLNGSGGLWMQTSSTSISLEQTSTTIVFGNAASSFGSTQGQAQPVGGQMDYSA